MEMTKRACPFESDVGRQLKVHVGQKEVNSGVLKEKQMQSVYDRTMNLLREGAKTMALNTSADDIKLNTSNIKCNSVDATKLKQTFLNNMLQIETTGTESQNFAVALCGCCRIIDSQSQCNRCDQILCTTCLTECADCLGSFCQNCSLLIYDNDERSLCLDCYR
ncbi:apoptosis regulatory protein Siva-like [Belonocnema kinseyi]|uniref:apoptosis regulatory protein Siva-like n=1 Tax=Belonocnema kinseyi TaxID=2817044 RepID=UPI00143D08DE|nr:apoptosis regulatory protein Siva-like [Belonocnema kinseyi]